MPPGYPPTYGAAPASGRNGLAVASLVLGILSLPLCFLFVPALLAVIFGIIALSQIKGNPGQAGRGQAIAGLILGGISLGFIVVAIILAGSATWEFESLEVGSWLLAFM